MLYLISHRGDSVHAPENTLAAFRKAAENGAKCVEFDVMLTGDGVPVVIHDETLDRTTNGSGVVGEQTLEYIRSLDAGSWFSDDFAGEKVPTLAETIPVLHALGLEANIEIKPCGDTAEATTDRVISMVLGMWPGDGPQPVISSFDYRCLEKAQAMAPHLQRGLLVHEWPEEDVCMLAAKYGCQSINLNHEILTAERVATMKAAGFTVLAYTVNDPDRAQTLEAWGVDGIFSDCPTRDHLLEASPEERSSMPGFRM